MSVSSTGSDRQRLLPATVEHSLNDLAIRVVGVALVAFAVTSWLSLLSWQQREAAAVGSGAKAARNLLGTFGASLSDMMVHTLGVAVVFALICPMVWGLELLASVNWIKHFRTKLLAAVMAVLALAGVASGLPTVPGWPLLGGSGGMIGDLVHNLAVSLAQRNGSDKGSQIVLTVLSTVGLLLLLKSLGIGGGLLALIRGGTKTVRESSNSTPAMAEPSDRAPVDASTEPDTAKVRVRVKARTQEHDALEEDGHQVAQASSLRSASQTLGERQPFPASLAAPAAPAFLRREMVSTFDRSSSATPITVGSVAASVDDASARADVEGDETARAFAERFAPGVATGKPKERKRIVPSVIEATLARARSEATSFRKPSLNLLRRGTAETMGREIDLTAGAAALLDALSQFGVRGEIREARSGPVVTSFELAPAAGVQHSRVVSLADDFAHELGVAAIRVSLPRGRNTIAIEVPNELREAIALRDIMECETFTASPALLPLALGKGVAGEAVVLDLARLPHLLVAGADGSGKSVGLDTMILSLVYRLEPSELRLLLIAPRSLELANYDRIPHLLTPVVTDVGEATQALEWAVAEMEERYRRLAQQSTRNIEAFNAKVHAARGTGVGLSRTVQTGFDAQTGRAIYERQQLDDAPMPHVVIVIDELADLMVAAGRRIESLVQRLAQKARAVGIHLVVATGRPSSDVLTGAIKAALPVRLCYRVASKLDSRMLVGGPGAEQLLGRGDLLLTSSDGHLLRVHGAHVGAEEVQRIADALRAQGEPQYVALLSRRGPPDGRANVASTVDVRAAAEAQQLEDAYAAAVAVVAGDRKVSAGHLHRRLGIEEAQAALLIERMEQEGLVGAPNLIGRRAILMKAPARPGARTAA